MSDPGSRPDAPSPPGETSPRDVTQGGMLKVPWAVGMDACKGYDTVSRVVLSAPFIMKQPMATHFPANAQSYYTDMKVLQVETIERLREVLQLGAEANVGYDAFSANCMVQFLKEARVDSYSLYFLIICYTRSTEVHVDEFLLDARFNSDRYGDSDFRQYFGDRFISGWVNGGYLIGLAELKATSQQSHKSIKDEVSSTFKAGKFEAGGGFSSAWEQWSARTDLSSRLEVTYAGVNGQRMRTLALSGGRPDEPVSDGTGGGGTLPSRPIRALSEDDVIVVDDDDDLDDPDVDDDDEDADAGGGVPGRGGRDVPAHSGAGGHDRGQPAAVKNLVPGTTYVDPVNYRKIEMNMQGLLDASQHLAEDVQKSGGVPLFAVLHPYAPLYRLSAASNVARAEIDRKRKQINDTYSEASRVFNSVEYALTKMSQFQAEEDDLKTLRDKMKALMVDCEAAWKNLNDAPDKPVTPDVRPPSDTEIPKWLVEKTKFDPFTGPPNPALFTKLIDEAVDMVLTRPDTPARKLLGGWLAEVVERSVGNYANAADSITALRLAIVAAYDDPGVRATRLKDMAVRLKRSLESWQQDSQALEASFTRISGQAGLDNQALDFLKHLKPVLFGPHETDDKQKYGFAAFWIAFHKGVAELAAQSVTWKTKAPLVDIVDYGGSELWSDRAKAFRAEAAVIDSRVRHKLDKA